MFEVMEGLPPFYQEDRIQMFRRICDCDYNKPRLMSREARDLAFRFLQLNPAMRIGMGKNGTADIYKHPFFKDFDWD